MELGKYYMFKFVGRQHPEFGFGQRHPDTKAKLLEESDDAYKVNAYGRILTWNKANIREAVPIHAGGKRNTRKAHRKGSRKSHHKSRRSYRK